MVGIRPKFSFDSTESLGKGGSRASPEMAQKGNIPFFPPSKNQWRKESPVLTKLLNDWLLCDPQGHMKTC